MWPLYVGELFMVGRQTAKKLHRLGINTIGDLATFNLEVLKYHLKSHGVLIRSYANGIEDSSVRRSNYIEMKGMGNSTTIAFDVTDRETAHMVLLSLCETVGMRLRASENCCRLVSVSIKTDEFNNYSRQRKLYCPTDSTKQIASITCRLFDEVWKGEVIRHLGVHVSELCSNEFHQTSIFDDIDIDKQRAVDKAIDKIRLQYGTNSVIRSIFLHSGINPTSGGVGEEDYPMMGSML
jgi:DNA polymerase-4